MWLDDWFTDVFALEALNGLRLWRHVRGYPSISEGLNSILHAKLEHIAGMWEHYIPSDSKLHEYTRRDACGTLASIKVDTTEQAINLAFSIIDTDVMAFHIAQTWQRGVDLFIPMPERWIARYVAPRRPAARKRTPRPA
jgi:hypothetical protein